MNDSSSKLFLLFKSHYPCNYYNSTTIYLLTTRFIRLINLFCLLVVTTEQPPPPPPPLRKQLGRLHFYEPFYTRASDVSDPAYVLRRPSEK